MSDRYTLRIARTAEKDLLDLQPKQFKQVVSKILSLQGTPSHKTVKPSKVMRVDTVLTRVSIEFSTPLMTKPN